jgi:hypothetical protein
LQLLNLARFVLRKHLRQDAVDSELAGNRVRDRRGVSGEHRHLHPLRVESLNGLV